jgi:beta-lactamase regulating signal transducer with metallopeptidase domain
MIETFAEAVAALSASPVALLLIKATIALVLGLSAARLAGQARASVRHLLLASTFAALVALPLAVNVVPALAVELRVAAPNQANNAAAMSETPLAAPGSADAGRRGIAAPAAEAARPVPVGWPAIAFAVWLAGAVWLIGSLLTSLWRLSRITRHGLPWRQVDEVLATLSTEAGVARRVNVLLHEQVAGPLTCGFRHPTILLPLDARHWSAADLRCALVHELEHVRRGDWAVQIAARAACALYWFHPLVWVAWRRLGLEAERACDDAVLAVARNTDYAEQLVQLAERLLHAPAQPALAMANRSDLSTRIAALLDGRQPRGRAGAWASAIALAAAATLVFALAPLRAVVISEAAAVTAGNSRPAQPSGRPRVRSLDRALVEAIQEDRADANEVVELLTAGADVNATVDGDGSPLIVAAREGRMDIVRLLLDRGADVNLAVVGDGSPLIMAAREGHADIVALLLDKGAQIDQVVPADENALIQASGEGQLAVVQLLVARGADVNARAWAEAAYERPRGEWRTPLNMARKGGHGAVVAFLISAGARD